jgi:glycosyltransferase involved in cell wall biosynthesis
VIHLANSLSSIDETKLKRVHDRPYLLFVGGRRTYKNFDYTVETLKDILIDRELDYICAGSGSFSDEEKKLFKKLGIEKRMIQMDVDDEKLASLYKYCECFIFPSLYEGFGLPAIESMSFGAPTILSDRSSLPEVGGDFALYINPEDAQSLINKVEDVLSSDFNKEEFSKKAKSWANNFSWEKMAIETVKTYERTLNL